MEVVLIGQSFGDDVEKGIIHLLLKISLGCMNQRIERGTFFVIIFVQKTFVFRSN